MNQIELRKRVAGVETVLGTSTGDFRGSRTLTLTADTSGGVFALEGPTGGGTALKFGVAGDTNIATGGAIASGGYGIYDATTEPTVSARFYNNFSVGTPTSVTSYQYSPINANRGTDLLHNTAKTEDTGGTSISPHPRT